MRSRHIGQKIISPVVFFLKMGTDLNDSGFRRVGEVGDGNLVVRDIAERVGFHLGIFQIDVQVTLGLLAPFMNYYILHVALLSDTSDRLVIV